MGVPGKGVEAAADLERTEKAENGRGFGKRESKWVAAASPTFKEVDDQRLPPSVFGFRGHRKRERRGAAPVRPLPRRLSRERS